MSEQRNNELLIETRGAALWLTINRVPQRNALTCSLLAQLTEQIKLAAHDASLRVIVLTGAGDKAFSVGADWQGVDALAAHPLVTFYEAIAQCGLPLIARVNGHAMGAGLGLVACCDLVVASDAALFAIPEIKVGQFPTIIMTYLLRLVPRRKLMAMVLAGDMFTAAQAVEYGLLNEAVPANELDDRIEVWVERLALHSPSVIKLGKQALQAIEDMSQQESLEYMALLEAKMYSNV